MGELTHVDESGAARMVDVSGKAVTAREATASGRVLVSPSKAFDGEWVSTFMPGTPLAIAAAVERLTAALPDGPWFPQLSLTRDFDRTEDRCPTPL